MIVDAAVHPILADEELGPRVGSPWNRASLPALLGQRAPAPFPLLAEADERAADPAALLEHMARTGVDHAILTPRTRGLVPHPLHLAAIASATNGWLHERWLEHPEGGARFSGSIRIPVMDARTSCAEIERWAADPRFVQVAVPLRVPAPYGDEAYFPIWEAAAARRLPVFVIDDGSRANIEPLPTPVGSPMYFAEYQALAPFAAIVHISSLITSGVFERLPDLVFVFADGGLDLARSMLWRVDKDWRGGRAEIPWVQEPPSSYLRRHVRFISHPEDGRPDGGSVDAEQLRVTEAADLTLFGSHYPFWDLLSPADLADWPADVRARVLASNALEAYPRLSAALANRLPTR